VKPDKYPDLRYLRFAKDGFSDGSPDTLVVQALHDAQQLGAELARSYDVVLMDHRTGLAPTVPAWLRALPGPIVVLDRLDGQSRRARRAVESLWRSLPDPGLLVSYVPSNDALEGFRERERGKPGAGSMPWLGQGAQHSPQARNPWDRKTSRITGCSGLTTMLSGAVGYRSGTR
jgi:hypothetical protein